MSVLSDGSVEYYDWWGYEITMVEVMADIHNFTWVYDPPADGLWGALEDSGNMSGQSPAVRLGHSHCLPQV